MLCKQETLGSNVARYNVFFRHCATFFRILFHFTKRAKLRISHVFFYGNTFHSMNGSLMLCIKNEKKTMNSMPNETEATDLNRRFTQFTKIHYLHEKMKHFMGFQNEYKSYSTFAGSRKQLGKAIRPVNGENVLFS